MNNPLGSNERIRLREQTILSDNWYTLRKVTFEYQRKNGVWETQSREAYDRGNGATILQHSKAALERVLSTPVISFAYPYGALNEDVKALAQKAGFTYAVATEDVRIAQARFPRLEDVPGCRAISLT